MDIEWREDATLKKDLLHVIKSSEIDWVDTSRIFTYKSKNAKTRAYARIWGLAKIWQQVLGVKPAYILEVISEKYDKLSQKQKDHVLMHELSHIPKNFSGALIPHIRRGKRNFYKKVNNLFKKMYF